MADGYIPHSEKGSNSYGQYVLLEDGTLIEWGRISVTVPASNFAEKQIYFPKRFSEYPAIMLTPELYSTPMFFSCIIRSISDYNPIIRVGNEHSSEVTITINWIAVGKA